jgi:hypothetical protein
MPFPFVFLGIFIAGASAAAVAGREAQRAYERRERRQDQEDFQAESDLRKTALRTAVSEAAVKDEARRAGVDVEQVLADLEVGRQPDVSEQVVWEILVAALPSVSPAGREAIQHLRP